MKKAPLVALGTFFVVGLACGTGPSGKDGSDGTDGEDGAGALVSIAVENAGEQCTDGGQAVSYGQDKDGDGTLDSSEVDGVSYLCDGTDGAKGSNGVDGMNGVDGDDGEKGDPGDPGDKGDKGDQGDPGEPGEQGDPGAVGPMGGQGGQGIPGDDGINSLISLTDEPGGPTCALGGTLVQVGMDDGEGEGEPHDGILHADEVDQSKYLCVPAEYPYQCYNYFELTDASRLQSNSDQSNVACDNNVGNRDWQGPGWYRVTGDAGTQIATTPAPGYQSCGTHWGAYVSSPLPTDDGVITESDACYSTSYQDLGLPCQYPFKINTIKCGSYYVYELANTFGCSLAYCTQP